ncbi:hypothetical protein ACOSQ4_022357 [Xanthoceras sorbifolium]
MAFIGLFEVFLAVICFFILHYLANNIKNNGQNFFLISQCTFLLKGPWFAKMDILVTTDPPNIHHIMSSNFTNFPKGPEFNQIFDVLGDAISNSDFDSWKNQRKSALALINNQSFHHFLLKTSRDKVENGMIPILEHRYTFDSTCILVTDYDPGCLSIGFPYVLFSRAMETTTLAWDWRREEDEKSQEDIRSDNKIGLNKQVDSEDVEFLTSYMNEDKDKANGLTCDDKFLRDTILNFIIFFWLVSKNPKLETRIREELESIIPEGKSRKWWEFDIQKQHKLAYLHGAICEALRLYPPVSFQHKAPVKPDIILSGHRVVPSTKIFMKILFSMYALGRMKSVWGEDCLEFKPERWILKKGGIRRNSSYKFLSFNAGPRTCLRKEVAFTQIKIVAATILHNYNVVQVVEDDTTNGPNVSVILQMKHASFDG